MRFPRGIREVVIGIVALLFVGAARAQHDAVKCGHPRFGRNCVLQMQTGNSSLPEPCAQFHKKTGAKGFWRPTTAIKQSFDWLATWPDFLDL
jgi:hypothetical protein